PCDAHTSHAFIIIAFFFFLSLCVFFLYCSPPRPHLHSFPTRRSSDLDPQLCDRRRGPAAGAPRRTRRGPPVRRGAPDDAGQAARSEEHTSELQSLRHLVCRLLLEKKKKTA